MDSKVIKNYILLIIAEKLKILYKLKKSLYLLVIILGDLIFYKNKVIYIKTKLLELKIKRWRVVISFNILLLKNNEAVLKMFWLWEYNLKIN